jgi:hypothetical protein
MHRREQRACRCRCLINVAELAKRHRHAAPSVLSERRPQLPVRHFLPGRALAPQPAPGRRRRTGKKTRRSDPRPRACHHGRARRNGQVKAEREPGAPQLVRSRRAVGATATATCVPTPGRVPRLHAPGRAGKEKDSRPRGRSRRPRAYIPSRQHPHQPPPRPPARPHARVASCTAGSLSGVRAHALGGRRHRSHGEKNEPDPAGTVSLLPLGFPSNDF